MEILEAHKIVMDKIKELENAGISVKRVNPYIAGYTYDKYEVPDRLPTDLYEHISFYPCNDAAWDIILKASIDLKENHNIYFDTGGGAGVRDWEIDWSFKGPNTKEIKVENPPDGQWPI